MSFRFWRRVRLAPGITLNLSKSTASLSFGPRGASYTLSPRGNRVTAGIPGTGLFYSVRLTGSRETSSSEADPEEVRSRLDLGFFRRLVTPAAEVGFVEAMRALHEGAEDRALARLEAAPETPDAAWMAGILRLQRGDLPRARAHLETALAGRDRLGRLYATYALDVMIDLPITPEVTAHIRPRARGTRLALAEVHQLTGDHAAARDLLRAILDEEPFDVVAKLSLAELLLIGDGITLADAEAVVRLGAGIGNETFVHTALLLHVGRALRRLGLHEAAVNTLTVAARRKKDRPPELLRAVRYERALSYADVGRKAQARREFARLHAEDPDLADVAERLGGEG
jgi:tetratricopeptide (TPR) repeat protein